MDAGSFKISLAIKMGAPLEKNCGLSGRVECPPKVNISWSDPFYGLVVKGLKKCHIGK